MPFDRICRALDLGTPLTPPVPLSGGYLHRMMALVTDRGRYAVKLLNPEIMQRPDAPGNFARAEAGEALLEAAGLPILPALTIHGRKMHCVDGQHLYVFDYFDGKPLPETAITPAHSRQMGAVLARIHAIGRRTLPGKGELGPAIDWAALAEALLADGAARADGTARADGVLLRDAIPLLTRVTQAADDALRRLPRVEALCHNDMDSKNVLWRGDEYRIIDLECVGPADPRQEMLDLAVSWGGDPLDEGCFKAFVSAYYAAGGLRPDDAALVFDSRRNYIDWLAHNARRALSPDPEERRIGRSQIGMTIAKIASDQAARTMILRWMAEV